MTVRITLGFRNGNYEASMSKVITKDEGTLKISLEFLITFFVTLSFLCKYSNGAAPASHFFDILKFSDFNVIIFIYSLQNWSKVGRTFYWWKLSEESILLKIVLKQENMIIIDKIFIKVFQRMELWITWWILFWNGLKGAQLLCS